MRENRNVARLLTPPRLPRSVGAVPPADRHAASPHFRDGVFHNTEPASVLAEESRFRLARDFARKGRSGRPSAPIPLVTPSALDDAARCAATWLGHATVLFELDGHWVLADPVWSPRVSPFTSVGPKRHHPVPLPLAGLPALSAVVISHDHYDHLDLRTVEWLTSHQRMPFVVPLGIGAHLRAWGVPEDRIVELDWEESHPVGEVTITCTEARHFSGRWLRNNTSLWSSWVLAGPEHRIFFGGDTGYAAAFAGIGEQHGPFDLTVLPIGAYDHRWPDIHMDPIEALRSHRDLHGGVLLPIHWATFDLAFHPWAEPVERLTSEAGAATLALPRPGERFDVRGALPTTPWWRG
ncbi:MBL fold metallo-hydrolase [Nocardioides dubius]|uniref:MBL fold metallo-hydrolase n=1 Tax=Nocardioides dubius TaxID=317019 RepID=A0ABN1U249_9ACTN